MPMDNDDNIMDSALQGDGDGNPVTQNEADSIIDSVTGSGPDFFDALDLEVNGLIQDASPKPRTQDASALNEKVTPERDSESITENGNNEQWEQRYRDSSKEATKLVEENSELKEGAEKFNEYKSIIDVMEKDSNAVSLMRQYLTRKQESPDQATSVQTAMGLPDDVNVDWNEAIRDAESPSAKILGNVIDGMIQHRIGETIEAGAKKKAERKEKDEWMKSNIEFREQNGLEKDDAYTEFVDKVKNHKISNEDMHYILNRKSNEKKIAESARQDIMNQMSTMRSIPSSIGASTNGISGSTTTPDNEVFDALKSLSGEDDIDSLFGND